MFRLGPHGGGRHVLRLLTVALTVGLAVHGRLSAEPETSLLIMINEVYTNSDGTKQFIELIALSEGQTNLAPTHVEAISGTAAETTMVHDFATSFPQLNNNETILLATAAVVSELGFNADRVIPDNAISLVDGRIVFDEDVGSIIDAVAYGAYTGNNTGFGAPAPALPTSGSLSLTRIRYSFVTPNNSTDFVWAVNSPKRNDGASGTLQGDPFPPVLAPIGPKSTDEGQNLNFAVSASDENGTSPSLSAIGAPPGASFVDHLNGSGTFNWTPNYLQAVIDTVLFIASDGTLADSEYVEITVNEVTDPPTARDSLATGSEDTPFLAQLQAYDPDADTLIYIIQSGPFRGQVSDFDTLTGAFTYTPNADLSGNDSLTFRVFDRHAYSGFAKWRVTIAPVNDPPVAADVVASTVRNYSVSIGTMPVTDIDDAVWTVAHVAGPYNGVVSNFQADDGSFTYTPALDFVGADSIIYRAADLADTSAHAVIRLTVFPECGCPCPGDPICDGVRSNVQDVVTTIGVAFRGTAPVTDPGCLRERTDVNCTGTTDVLDVVKVVGVAFRGQSAAVEYCNPCAP
ncbi:MAG TPA: tandem-95 repeat protein [bacterium]|nr:tandem-95 repeat protein [bacterium]